MYFENLIKMGNAFSLAVRFSPEFRLNPLFSQFYVFGCNPMCCKLQSCTHFRCNFFLFKICNDFVLSVSLFVVDFCT